MWGQISGTELFVFNKRVNVLTYSDPIHCTQMTLKYIELSSAKMAPNVTTETVAMVSQGQLQGYAPLVEWYHISHDFIFRAYQWYHNGIKSITLPWYHVSTSVPYFFQIYCGICHSFIVIRGIPQEISWQITRHKGPEDWKDNMRVECLCMTYVLSDPII